MQEGGPVAAGGEASTLAGASDVGAISAAESETRKLGDATLIAGKDAEASAGLFGGLGEGLKGMVETAAPIAALFGVGLGIKETIDVVGQAQQSMADLNQAFANTKSSIPSSQVKELDDKMAQFGHDDADANEALAKTTLATGDAKRALGDMSTIAELAAYKHISLTDAASLYTKAAQGQAKALKDLGIPTMITAQTSAQALANMQLTLTNATTTLHNAQLTVTQDQEKYDAAVKKSGAGSPAAVNALDTLTKAHAALDKAQLTVTNDQAKLTEAQKAATDPLYQQNELNKELQSKLKGLAEAQAHTLPGAMAAMGAKVKNFLGDAGQGLLDWFNQNQDSIMSVAGTIGNVALQAFDVLRDGINRVVGALINFYNKNKETFDTIAHVVATLIKVAFPVALKALEVAFGILANVIGFVSNVLSFLGPIIRFIVTVIGDLDTIIITVIGAILDFGNTIGDTVNGAKKVVSVAMDAIKAALAVVGNFFSSWWQDIVNGWNRIVTGAQAVAANVLNFIGGIPGKIMGAFSGAINWLYNIGKDILQGLWNGEVNLWTSILTWVWQIPGHIMDAFKDAGKWLFNAGKAILDGLLNGMKQSWNDVTGFVGGIGNWISSHKGPIEVDAVLLKPHGNAIMQGLNVGLQQGFSPVQNTIHHITQQIASPETSIPIGTHAPSPVASSGGGGSVYIDLRESKFFSNRDIDELLKRLGKRFGTNTLPHAGVKISR